MYSNLIKATSSGYGIKRQKDLYLHINCKMLQNTWKEIMYNAEDYNEVNETQYSRYNVNISLYESPSFSRPVTDFPYYVDLNQNLFLQASINSSDPNLVLFLDTCVASPDPNDFTTATYDIIKSGIIRALGKGLQTEVGMVDCAKLEVRSINLNGELNSFIFVYELSTNTLVTFTDYFDNCWHMQQHMTHHGPGTQLLGQIFRSAVPPARMIVLGSFNLMVKKQLCERRQMSPDQNQKHSLNFENIILNLAQYSETRYVSVKDAVHLSIVLLVLTDPTTTTSWLSSTAERYTCGGVLQHSSGTLSSPFYPGNYPNNADCVWEIEAMNNFCITLLFRDIATEDGNCRYDYIEIYDGPLNTSPLIAKICYGSYLSYTSSSNLMTVRFHSDSSVTNTGFRAEYYTIPADQNITLLCLPEYMHAVVSRAYLRSHGYSAWDVSLNDTSCTPTITPSHVIFNIPYNRCGTSREGNNDTIIYSNLIKAISSGYIIKRQKDLYLHITCKMLQNKWIEKMYVADDITEVNELQYSRYDMNISFYESSSFLRPVYASPYYVDLNQNLFLQASIHSSDPNLVLFLDTCVASPDPNDFTRITYTIVRSGCPRDATYTTYYSPSSSIIRFKFNAFTFINRHPSVYLQFKMVVCRVDDGYSRCYRGCIPRHKRDTSSYQEKVDVIVGPIQLRKDRMENRNAELDYSKHQEDVDSRGSVPAIAGHS
ncbi:scavenger receptor cysteine-rich domain-containing protein DMBT1-like [Pelodiscus sinensis]|uniref:scavenger receptor cysteine-rich domain-containing protein DMBT1-like n=1 Tax=Pelodiscus sinensis TaxID=13735 RepID=UPI003F6C3B46